MWASQCVKVNTSTIKIITTERYAEAKKYIVCCTSFGLQVATYIKSVSSQLGVFYGIFVDCDLYIIFPRFLFKCV